ncbi:MAG: hypothetical protein GY788_12305 [bacterium]|nr:hypothetical protein [bacterium]
MPAVMHYLRLLAVASLVAVIGFVLAPASGAAAVSGPFAVEAHGYDGSAPAAATTTGHSTSLALGAVSDLTQDAGYIYDVSANFGATNTPVPNPKPQYLPDGTPNRGPAAWVNTIDESGSVVTHASSPPRIHAEVNAQLASPGSPMSSVWGWRGPRSAPVWQEIRICSGCQAKFPPSLFPSSVRADPGPWGW